MSNNVEQLDVESAAADKAAHRGEPALDVLHWLHQVQHGVLGTLSTEPTVQGFPTGSIVPFALDHCGRPFIFIANIALHTRNLKRDDRASLFIHEGGTEGDPQSHWRVSLNGHFVRLSTGDDTDSECEKISDDEYDQLMARYSQRVPRARGYARTHDFHFWRMKNIESIRYIAGFGRICSFPGHDYLALAGPDQFEAMRAGALSHMNDDHVANMKEICRAFHAIDSQRVHMAALERTGCLFKSSEPDGYHFSPFESVVDEPQEFKSEIIALLHRARAVEAQAIQEQN